MIVTKNMATTGADSPHAESAARNDVAPGGTPVHLSVGEAGCGGPRGLWGWSPPRRPAETALERRVDRFFPRSGVRCLLFVLAIIALLSVAPHLPTRERLGADAVAFLAAGGWCALNFWRCRHAHCALSGAGWLALGVLALAEAGLGHSLIGGYEQPAFLGVLVIAVIFEGAWYLQHGTNAMARGAATTWPPRHR
jgi:hypothetical protein